MLLISAATLGLLATMTQPSRLRPRSRYPLFIAAALLTLGLAGLAAAIAWGGPHDIPPLSSINNPFKGVDYGGVPHAGPQTLMGFSAGGGFALRFAGSARQDLFDRYVLLSPFLHHNAPTSRPDSGGWVSVGLPRMVAITLLNQIGITRWNHLPVLSFALNDVARELLTPRYSYTVATNFRPHDDYQADIRNARGTVCIVAGQDDDFFPADPFADLFAKSGKPVPVTLVPGVNHMGLTLDAQAVGTVARHACPAEPAPRIHAAPRAFPPRPPRHDLPS